MNRYTCTDCQLPIPSGMAVIRTVSFERIALHKDCAEARGITLAVPTQRRSAESIAR